MPLLPDEIKEMVKELSIADNFHILYSFNNRKWFVNYMITAYVQLHPTENADAIKGRIKVFIDQCKVIAKAKQNFTIGVPFSAELVTMMLRRRIEIIYGSLADEPGLANAANENYLEFTIKRRYRTVMRMDYFVNPNFQGYFRYPRVCSETSGFQVNTDATNFWEMFISRDEPFFKLTTPPPVGPTAGLIFSLNKLFIAKKMACESNLLDCARVISILFMDSLLEASDKNTLFSYLESKPPTSAGIANNHPYIAICHPNDVIPDTQFITDTTAEGLFSKVGVTGADLQVGDHAYMYNHPLYKVFVPNGSWRGEHALVYSLGNRDYKSKGGYLFGGHGKEGTLFEFYSAFMKELQTYIARTYHIAKIHLEFMQAGVPSDGDYYTGGGSVTVATSDNGVALFEYHVPFTYMNLVRKKEIQESNFLIVHMPGESFQFWIDKQKTIAEIVASDKLIEPIPIFRRPDIAFSGTLSDDYNPEFYSIAYEKNNTPPTLYFDLFLKTGTVISPKKININELFEDPFLTVPGSSLISTTQPKVDLSASHQSFLKTNGAII